MEPATVLAALALALCAEPLAAAQGGYTTEKHPGLGLEFPMARDYVPIPVEPTEKWVVLYYAEKPPSEKERERDKKKGGAPGMRPELRVVYVDYVSDPSPITGEPEPPAPEGEEAADEPEAKPAPPAKPPINSFERWLEQQFTAFEVAGRAPGKKRGDYQGCEYELRSVKTGSGVKVWAYTWVADLKRTVALVGACSYLDFDEQIEIWRYVADRLKVSEPEDKSLDKLERMYAGKKLLDVPYRIEIRSQLVRGWKADDTENYIVVYSTKDEPLVRAIKSELEAVRGEYERLFPPVTPIEAVSTVRVCRDRDEYFQYGGPGGSGGYWNSEAQELVFYDYENVDGKKGTGKANSRIVLYHEAFHQFIHYSCGELAPHSWFNEGTGDYFSGARIAGGKVQKIGVNPWRIRYVKAALEAGQSIPWSEIIAFEQPEFYRPDRRGLCYAQAWSMIYFLRTAPAIKKFPAWQRILPTYFDQLKAVWASERAALTEGGRAIDPAAKAEAEKRAREAALAKAFEGIDIAALESAWRQYTLSLEAD